MNAYPDQFRLTESHLTETQLDDHLIGDLAPIPAAHLAACALCTQRAEAAAAPIASFQHVSTAWSERRSATLPIPAPTQNRPLWQRHMAWATASLSLAFGIAFLNATRPFAFNATPQPAPTVAATAAAGQPPTLTPKAPAPRTTQISADNHMLQAIDASLDPSTDSPAALGLTPAAASTTGPPASIQD
jgi:hypothetical protein